MSSRLAAFDKEGVAVGIVRNQLDGTIPTPKFERICLVVTFPVGKLEFENNRTPLRELGEENQ